MEEKLTQVLKEAKQAHTKFEQMNGPHPEWEQWYAQWMLRNYPTLFSAFYSR